MSEHDEALRIVSDFIDHESGFAGRGRWRKNTHPKTAPEEADDRDLWEAYQSGDGVPFSSKRHRSWIP